MKASTQTVVILSVLALIAIVAVCLYFHYNNREISLRKRAIAQRGNIEAVYDNMWKIIKEQAEVTDKYERTFRDIYPQLMAARYGNATEEMMKWVQEANPNLSPEIYIQLMNTVEIFRTEFTTEQTTMLDIVREHSTLCSTYPSKWFIKNKEEIKYKVVSSTHASEIMECGVDDSVALF